MGHHSERARQVVLLVIATIALPSVLLTGLGIAAIENEEAAARKRLETAYMPVLSDLAKSFNERMDLLLFEAEMPLQVLTSWVEDGEEEELEPFLAFASSTPFAINYFVIDADGDVAWPQPSGSCAEAWSKVVAAKRPNCAHGASCRCDDYASMANDPSLDGSQRCAASFADALCRAEREGAAPDVPECLPDTGIATALLQTSATGRAELRSEDWAGAVGSLTARMTDPRSALSDSTADVAAWWFRPRLESIGTAEAEAASDTLRLIGSRGPLLDVLRTVNSSRDVRPMVSTWSVDGLRRVLVTSAIDDGFVGFELSPQAMRLFMRDELEGLEIDAPLDVHLAPVEAPAEEHYAFKERYANRTVTWALLKKTQLAWELIVTLDEDGGLFDLVHSRSRLYMWSLGLIVVAMLGGILYTLRAVLREAHESRLKTDFVSSVSHDLRTPLTSIRMFTESLLMGRVNDEQEVRESLEVIASETERLSRLTERILDFSRMEAGRKAYAFQPTSVGLLVEHALTACAPIIEADGFEVDKHVEADLPRVSADRDAMIEALINLVSNAVKYSPDHKRIRVWARREGNGVAISVEDRGMGIPRSEQQKIFERFYRIDCRRTTEVGGCGLGLSLVKHIVEAHGGALRVDSSPGRGSTFTIHLGAVQTEEEWPAVGDLEGEAWKTSSS